MGCVVEIAANDLCELEYGFESREQYLRQYSSLVNQFYKKDLDLDLAENNMNTNLESAGQDEFIYLVRDGEQVIAGAKISFSYIASNNFLPMEEKTFRVKQYLPEGYGNKLYAEIGRLVVDPSYRGKDVLQTMVSELVKFSLSRGCEFLFVLAPALNAVLYRRICRSLGIPIEIHKDAQLPEKELYRRLDIKFLSCDISGYGSQQTSLPEADFGIAV